MDAPQADTQGTPESPKPRSFLRRLGRLFYEIVVAVIRFSFLFAIFIAAIIGGCDLVDTIFPEKVPEPTWIGFCVERSIAPFNNSQWHKFSDDSEENWRKLQPSLKILRKVVPEAARWVEDRHAKGLIVWERQLNGTLAHYNPGHQRLTLNEAMLSRCDGEKAVTMAHEFRHSRQSTAKRMKLVILTALTGEYQEWVIENDAYDYGRQVYIAIFGF